MAKKKLLIDNTNILKQICDLAHLNRGLLVCFSNPDLDLQFKFRVFRSKLNSNAATEFATRKSCSFTNFVKQFIQEMPFGFLCSIWASKNPD